MNLEFLDIIPLGMVIISPGSTCFYVFHGISRSYIFRLGCYGIYQPCDCVVRYDKCHTFIIVIMHGILKLNLCTYCYIHEWPDSIEVESPQYEGTRLQHTLENIFRIITITKVH